MNYYKKKLLNKFNKIIENFYLLLVQWLQQLKINRNVKYAKNILSIQMIILTNNFKMNTKLKTTLIKFNVQDYNIINVKYVFVKDILVINVIINILIKTILI